MSKCLFMKKECKFEDIPRDVKWCRVCTDSSVGTEIDKMTRMTIINGLLQMHQNEDKAREVYRKLKEFAEEW